MTARTLKLAIPTVITTLVMTASLTAHAAKAVAPTEWGSYHVRVKSAIFAIK